MGKAERGRGVYFLVVLVEEWIEVAGKIYLCILILSVIRTPEEDVLVQEPHGIGGGILSGI